MYPNFIKLFTNMPQEGTLVDKEQALGQAVRRKHHFKNMHKQDKSGTVVNQIKTIKPVKIYDN